MPDQIGNISVPGVVVSPAVFPIVLDTGYGFALDHPLAIHQFGSGDAKVEQRFKLGDGMRHFIVRRAYLTDPDRRALRDFWEARKGPYEAFHYSAPSNDGTSFEDVVVRFAVQPLSWQMVTDWVCTIGVELIEIPQTTPTYELVDTLDRFPSEALATALLDQVQVVIPLVMITPKMPRAFVVTRNIGGVRVYGNAVPWDDQTKNFDRPFWVVGSTSTSVPVMLASDLVPGEKIHIPIVNGAVAYQNLGWGAYVGTGPAGAQWGDVLTAGIHDDLDGGGPRKYPSYYCQPAGGLGHAGLIGAWTDMDGNVVKVVPVGAGGVTLTVPPGACQFQLGINRPWYGDWDGGTGGATSYFEFGAVGVGNETVVEYPPIYLSDRRVQIGDQLYQARLLKWDGISQGMTGESDEAQFVFGNADRAMRDLANDVDLYRASVQFSLFHVGTGIKLDLWKGEIIDWSLDQGPEFHVQAADGLYELRLPYPTRKIARSCWKIFNDTKGCPWTGYGPDTCDKGWKTPLGCDKHQMDQYYGGITTNPQQVRIKDNASGWHGLGRNTITASSQIADSVYDQVISEVYTDDKFPVAGRIAAGREESDFYDALAIICEGPITFAGPYTDANGQRKGHTLDGQFWHGYPARNMGLREVPGNDPTDPTDYFSLSRVGTDPGPGEVTDGHSVYLKQYAAGTAFLEIRRSDQKGVQLSRPTDHSVEAIIQTGLEGWVWTAPGTRAQQVLTNPVWIVVNMLLRARGMKFASAAECETQFDVSAAIAAAAVCDTDVTPLVGSDPTETQFKFRGALQEEKPLKDWISEVLMNCAGYFTWANGKMKIGLRTSAAVVETFDNTNMLFGSLQLSPLKPTFNHLSASFAEAEFDYAANTVVLYDLDHARLIGGATAPLFLKSTMNLAGTYTKSQAARLITMRLREELGGTSYAQWKAARNIAFKTTILALNTEPGQVDQLNHADMPVGTGKYRVVAWKLNADYSIEIQGRAVVDEMYNVAIGNAASDAAQGTSTLDSPTNGDVAAPAAPIFTITPPGDGTAKLTAPTWADPANTNSLTGATWTIRYYDLGSTYTTLSGGITDAAASMVVASAAGLYVGDLLAIGRECVKVTSIAGPTIGILRAQCGSAAVAHLNSENVRRLSTRLVNDDYDPAQAATWADYVALSDAYIASADCHGNNAFGPGADATNNYLDQGTDTFPGLYLSNPWGQLYLINGG